MRQAFWMATVAVIALASSSAWAKGGKGLDLFTTVGSQWAFDVTEQEPGGDSREAREVWKVAQTEGFGAATKSYIVISELVDGSENTVDRQVEYAVQGDRFYDISRLEKGRRALEVEPSDLKGWIPLIDLSKLGKEATVVRYPDNPLAYVRYERVGEFRLPSGEIYKDAIHATRNRGDEETTDDWWYSPTSGVLKIQLKLPPIAGGTTITWVRTPSREQAAPAAGSEAPKRGPKPKKTR